MAIVVGRNGIANKYDEERRKGIRQQIRGAKATIERDSQAYIDRLAQRIEDFERRSGYTSESMMDKLDSGEIHEDAKISQWVWAWQTLQNIRQGIRMTGMP